MKGCMEKHPKWHLIDCKILQENCFNNYCLLQKKIIDWDQEHLELFPIHSFKWHFFSVLLSNYIIFQFYISIGGSKSGASRSTAIQPSAQPTASQESHKLGMEPQGLFWFHFQISLLSSVKVKIDLVLAFYRSPASSRMEAKSSKGWSCLDIKGPL